MSAEKYIPAGLLAKITEAKEPVPQPIASTIPYVLLQVEDEDLEAVPQRLETAHQVLRQHGYTIEARLGPFLYAARWGQDDAKANALSGEAVARDLTKSLPHVVRLVLGKVDGFRGTFGPSSCPFFGSLFSSFSSRLLEMANVPMGGIKIHASS